MYFSYSVFGGEFDYQVVGQSHDLPRVEGRSSKDGSIVKRSVDHKECNVFSELLRIITNRNGQRDRTKGVYFSPSKPNESGVGRAQLFSVNPHLLECRVVEDISRASIVDQDLVCVVISYSYANNECIIMRVVETSGIFF